MVENHNKIRFRTRKGQAKSKIKFPNGYPEWYLEIDCEGSNNECFDVSPTIKNVFTILDSISIYERGLNHLTGYYNYKFQCYLIWFLIKHGFLVEFRHFDNYITGDSYFIIENLVQTKILDFA